MIDPFYMIDLFYPSTYHAMKAGPCRVGVCKHEGECRKCIAQWGQMPYEEGDAGEEEK